MPERVVIGLPASRVGSQTEFAARIARALATLGHEVRILLLGRDPPGGDDDAGTTAVPADLSCDRLPVARDDALVQLWEALERYLEERAPCTYLMWPGSTINDVVPRLSGRVRVIGIVDSDEVVDSGALARLGPSCNAIVTMGDQLHFTVACRMPYLAAQTFAMGPPARDESSRGEDRTVRDLDAILARVDEQTRRRTFIRRRVDPAWPELHHPAVTVPWPECLVGGGRVVPAPAARRPALENHRVLVACSPGTIRGADVFAVNLVRGLRERGIDARLHGRAPDGTGGIPTLASDQPFDERDPALDDEHLGWPTRWRRMIAHLVQLAPCIYVPNCDGDFSCICPRLPDGVRVVGIGHSDDPWHYDHLCRIGSACDALVGASDAITRHLRALAPEVASRIETIPYGIPSSRARLHASPAPDDGRIGPTGPRTGLRIMYAGRLVIPQKRVLDLVAIARALEARGVPYEMTIVGEGDDRRVMERAAVDLIRNRRLWFMGGQPNSSVLSLLQESDVFLLPSSFEGLSIGMLEAMSRGVVPVVSAVRSGVPDVIVPGVNGLVAPVGDIATFADRLEWLWRNPAERARMAAAAASTVDAGYRLENMIDRYIDLFRRIIANPITRPTGAMVPPRHLAPELTWSLWASRVASDPAASLRRVARRFIHPAR